MSKAPDAFRTISEVADWLETPAHVLRFWESKFTQVKPVKRAGGRRYYRPSDMLLLGGIKRLLHQDGKTIKEVQNLLREQGVKQIAGLSLHGISDDADQVVESTAAPSAPEVDEKTVIQGVFRTVGTPKEQEDTAQENENQMMFPGFEFSSDRKKQPPEPKQESPRQPFAAQKAQTTTQAPTPIDTTHIPEDPTAPPASISPGLLSRLSALSSGSLANKPKGLKQAVEKLASIAESRASSENS